MVRNKNQNMPAFAHIDARGDVDLRALPVGTRIVTTGGTANQDRTLTALECTNGASDRTSTYRRKTNYEDYAQPLNDAAARADITIIHGHRNAPHDMPRVVAAETATAPGYVVL